MEAAKFTLAVVKTLVWPATVLAIAFGLRREIVAIVSRLKKADLPGGISLDFAEEVDEVRQLLREVEEDSSPKHRPPVPAAPRPSIPLTEANARMIGLGLQPSPSGLDMDYYRNLATQDPNLALAGLRIEVDVLARNLAKVFKVPVGPRESGARLLGKLRDSAAITDAQFKLVQKVLRLCNAAVHGSPVSKEQADSVINSGDVLVQQYLDWLSWGFGDGWRPTPPSDNA